MPPSRFSFTDTLSDVLRALRLTGAVYFRVRGRAPWVAVAPPSRDVAVRIMPEAQHVIEYHAVTEGECWGGVAGGPQVRLGAGDVIAFPRGDSHVLSSAPGMAAPLDTVIFDEVERTGPPLDVVLGPPGPPGVGLVCGFLGCDVRPYNPLLATLPRVLTASDRAGGALRGLTDLAVVEAEARRPGSTSVLARVSELLFVEVIRRHLERLPEGETGWLAGLRDPFVGRALAALHGEPARPWTLDGLARAAGLSRSALAARFVQLVGEPPMGYLARWRMQLAARRLEDGGAGVAEVAAEVGYGSEAAFSRAFKKLVGVPPAAWRRRGDRHPSA
jgi:AraC-like DNA-binding protein